MLRTRWASALLLVWLLLAGAVAGLAQEPSAQSAEQRLVAAADEVERQVSAISGLKPTAPIPKRLKSREEIRQYVMEQMREQYPAAKLRGDRLALERFGLLPKNFPLEKTLIDVLTEQMAAYYDPKRKEFYVADWIPVEFQRPIMAHELTHALQDQNYNVEHWLNEVRNNDDALLARDSVLEGSATAVMFEFLYAPQGQSISEMYDLDELLRMVFLAGLESQESLNQAPPYIREVLVFPYLAGARFFQRMLNLRSWKATDELFAHPPRSTREILHPDVYLAQNPVPDPVAMPALDGGLAASWKRLDENVLGEFGLKLVLAQELLPEEAEKIADGWRGDRYQIYENNDGSSLLIHRSRWSNANSAKNFFDAYRRTRQKRYSALRVVHNDAETFQTDTAEGGVFVRCREAECLIVEGATAAEFREIERRVWSEAATSTMAEPAAARF